MAHARTLLVAHHHREEFQTKIATQDNMEHCIISLAWKHVFEWTGCTMNGELEKPKGVDVDSESIRLLDKIMFDESTRAGVAGNHQWGLDVGPHEGGGDPQLVGPSVTPHDMRRDGDDDEEVVVCL